MPKYRDLLKDKDFLLYSIGQVISQFGDRLVMIVLVGLVYKLSPGSAMQLAKTISFTLIPAFVASPIAGVWVDRLNNKKTMITCDILRGLSVLAIAYFVTTGQIIPIYIIILFIYTCACFFLPAKFAIIPDLVTEEKFILANSVSTITTIIGGVAGFTVGGIILELIDVKNTIYLTALVYFTSAASISFMAYRSKREYKGKKGGMGRKMKEVLKTSFIFELKEGLKYLFSGKQVRFVVYALFTLTAIVGAIGVVAVVFIQDVMGTMTKDIGLFGFFLCIGLLIGSYIYGKKGHSYSKEKAIFATILGCGIAIGLFAVTLKATASFAVGAAFVFLLGIFSAPVMISANTIVHENIDDSMRGRIFSSLGIIMNLGWIIFMFIASGLAEAVGKLPIILTGAAAFTGFGILGLLLGGKNKKGNRPTSS